MMGKTIGIAFAVLLGIFALGWAIQGNDFFMYKFWAPKYENVRREVFENTKSYKQGMIQELQNMQFEYAKATPSQRDSMASIILHRSADFPLEDMPADLRSFISSLRSDRTKSTSKY
jgi:hypothetical protein